jgi:peptidoglycan glycosyltransferase
MPEIRMSEIRKRTARLERINLIILVSFLLIGLSLTYWGVARATAMGERADNPRRVEAELRIRRGQILDSNGVVLAETVGPEDALERVYAIPNIGPAVGYYSFRHGTAGVEEGYDEVLRGDSTDVWEAFWRQNLHQAQVGRDIRLTLNADWQRAADALMGDRQGALVLLSLPDGAVRAMVSHPGYDPNLLDEQFESLAADEDAPLLNRATQGRYQPGLVLQPFLLGTAVDRGWLELNEAVEGAGETVLIQGHEEQCRMEPPLQATWIDVLQNACPGPLLSLAPTLEEEELTAVYERFGFLQAPNVPLTTAAPANGAIVDMEDALLGQGELTVTPMQVALAWAALGNEGRLPAPRLISAILEEGGSWQTLPEKEGVEAISPQAASAILSALPRYEGVLAEYSTLVLSGPGTSTNSWYMGLAPAGSPRYAVVVVVEDTDRVFASQQVGRSLLNFLLDEPVDGD